MRTILRMGPGTSRARGSVPATIPLRSSRSSPGDRSVASRCFISRKTPGVPDDAAVGEGQQPVPDVAHRQHPEGPTQLRRAAPGVEGRDEVDRVVGVADEALRQASERGTPGEEEEPGPVVGSPLEPGRPEVIGDRDPAGHVHGQDGLVALEVEGVGRCHDGQCRRSGPGTGFTGPSSNLPARPGVHSGVPGERTVTDTRAPPPSERAKGHLFATDSIVGQAAAGALAPLRGAARMVRTPRLWLYALIPQLVGGVWGLVVLIEYLTVGETVAWYATVAKWAWQGVLLAALVMIQLAIALCAPVLDRLSERTELHLRLETEDRPFWRGFLTPSFWRRLLAEFREAFKLLGVKLGLLVVGLVIGILPLVGAGTAYVLAGIGTGLDFIDYPLQRRGLSTGQKVAWARARSPATAASN